MLYLLQQLLNGLHMGAIYAMLAFGYALINSVLRRTNLAHGAIFGFAGQIMVLTAVYGWQVLWLTLPATLAFGFAVALFYGAVISAVLSRSVFLPLLNRLANTVVAATLGVSIVLMELGRIAAETRDYWLSPMLSQPVVFGQAGGFTATLTTLQVVNCAVVLALLLTASWALPRSRFGREWQAVSDDRLAAALCGVDGGRVFRQSLVWGGLGAAFAGIIVALYYGNISFGAGLVYGLKILFVTAVGGYLSPPRAAMGAALFGVAESLWSGYFPIEWRDGWMLGFLVVLLVLRTEREMPEKITSRV